MEVSFWFAKSRVVEAEMATRGRQGRGQVNERVQRKEREVGEEEFGGWMVRVGSMKVEKNEDRVDRRSEELVKVKRGLSQVRDGERWGGRWGYGVREVKVR